MPIFRTVCAALLSIAALAACSSGRSANEASKTPKPSAPSFEGTYRFVFDGTQQLAGGESKPTKSRTRMYAVRSACTDTGCIATATKLADDDPKRKSDPPMDLVLDYIGGHWQMAVREESSCADNQSKGSSITVWILQPQLGETLTGTSSVAMNPSPDCAVATQTPVTVTRLRGIDPGISVADPSTQTPLSPSAPDGLTGHYNETSVLHDSARPGVRRIDMQTTCVRNTDQCATFKFYRTASGTPVVHSLLFSDGKWAFDRHVDVNCPNGATASTVKHEEYRLPKPATHPLQRVTGSILIDATASCPAQQLDIELERTGD